MRNYNFMIFMSSHPSFWSWKPKFSRIRRVPPPHLTTGFPSWEVRFEWLALVVVLDNEW